MNRWMLILLTGTLLLIWQERAVPLNAIPPTLSQTDLNQSGQLCYEAIELAQEETCTFERCAENSSNGDSNIQLAQHFRKHQASGPCRGKGYAFIFSPRRHRWYACRNDQVMRSGVAAGGAHYCRDTKRSGRTPCGRFRILSKGGSNCRSSSYPLPNGGARMSYCMFFTSAHAIHGAGHVPAANVSHGCVRVTPEAARWLSQNFIRVGTTVIVEPY